MMAGRLVISESGIDAIVATKIIQRRGGVVRWLDHYATSSNNCRRLWMRMRMQHDTKE